MTEFKQLLQTQKSLSMQAASGTGSDSGSCGQLVEVHGTCLVDGTADAPVCSAPSAGVSLCMLGDNHGLWQELVADTT